MSVKTLQLRDISEYLGSSALGRKTHGTIQNHWYESTRIVCDFEDVLGMTGAFADEAFGKMFTEKGSGEYAEKMQFRNLNSLVELILKCTLFQRYDNLNRG